MGSLTLRCLYCNQIQIRKVCDCCTWEYECSRCHSRRSSTGLNLPPQTEKHRDWRPYSEHRAALGLPIRTGPVASSNRTM